MATLQTLDRGLRILELVAHREDGANIAELAEWLGVHRAVAYRLITTLAARGLVARHANGRIFLGGGIMMLASGLEPQLRALAFPHLRDLAHESLATAYLSIAQGDECVVILVTEPESSILRVGYRVGSRHPLSQGAAGIAILSGRAEQAGESEAVRKARADGFAVTRGQIQAGAVGLGVPILSSSKAMFRLESCIGVVAMSDMDIDVATQASLAHARRIAVEVGQ